MRVPSPFRRTPAKPLTCALAASVVAGALLPVAFGTSAHAADACTTEVAPTNQLGVRSGAPCDDQSPPETTITAQPQVSAAGYASTHTLTFDFTGAYTDADTDPIVFQCQFFQGTAPTDWSDCTSPVTYDESDGVKDTTDTPFTFRVRAIDRADHQIDATAAGPLGPTLQPGAATDLPDLDESPAQAQVFVDTTAPQTYIFGTPSDLESPQRPMTTTNSPTLQLAASERSVALACTVNDRSVPCSTGKQTFRRLAPGETTITAQATDRADNVGNIAQTTFWVPADITVSDQPKWTTYKKGGYFGRTLARTTRRGATLSFEGTDVREVRLLATTGPGQGLLKYKTPGMKWWKKIPLGGKTLERKDVVLVRGTHANSFTGAFRLKTFRGGRPVSLDAIMMR
ncbi:hypothetical protein [Nocardioides acrostichi]|uniref:HYR domain-containing protein n=1 Tax=Nocardioides acrostichi TaxID=2784339 RepID=A0A930YCV9_9ACTN|nr:hypothetical protein [Nocardioides acrostichi]MBF4163913.1 hypothetical protein [Nocardioides acrostichi]